MDRRLDFLRLWFERNYNRNDKLIIVADKLVWKTWESELSTIFKAEDINIVLINAEEKSKNLSTCSNIWNFFQKCNIDKSYKVLAIGGGLTLDVVGFCAVTYHRGISCTYIPTTLLAMVDAAYGGKTGINLNDFKNQVGTISLPEDVVADWSFLESLPSRHILSGYSEMLKVGLVMDSSLYDKLSTIPVICADFVVDYIDQVVKCKLDLVETDLYDFGVRQLLNFGHTIGHGIEAHGMHNGLILHGEAVAIGMWAETLLSYMIGLLNPLKAERIINHIYTTYEYLKDEYEFDSQAVLHFMQKDKKKREYFNFSLISDIGAGHYSVKVSHSDLVACLLRTEKVWTNG